MTYIVLSDSMGLSVTQADTIRRGDSMSKAITFLVPVKVDEMDMKGMTVFLSYIRTDGNPDIVILEREEKLYKNSHYRYVLPVTCKMSRYAGEVLMWLSFYSGDSSQPEIAKSGECKLRIADSKNLDDCFGDHQLTALYQLKKKVEDFHGEEEPETPSDPEEPETPEDPEDPGDNGSSDEDEDGFGAVEF